MKAVEVEEAQYSCLYLWSLVSSGEAWGGGGTASPNPDELAHLDDIILLLEDCPSKRTLATIIQSVGVCSMLNKETDEVSMAVVCSKHELLPAVSQHSPHACTASSISSGVRPSAVEGNPYQCVAFLICQIWWKTSSDGLLQQVCISLPRSIVHPCGQGDGFWGQ